MLFFFSKICLTYNGSLSCVSLICRTCIWLQTLLLFLVICSACLRGWLISSASSWQGCVWETVCQNVNACTEKWCSGVVKTELLVFNSTRNVRLDTWDTDVAPPCFSPLSPTVAVDRHFRGKYLAPSMLLDLCLAFYRSRGFFDIKQQLFLGLICLLNDES